MVETYFACFESICGIRPAKRTAKIGMKAKLPSGRFKNSIDFWVVRVNACASARYRYAFRA